MNDPFGRIAIIQPEARVLLFRSMTDGAFLLEDGLHLTDKIDLRIGTESRDGAGEHGDQKPELHSRFDSIPLAVEARSVSYPMAGSACMQLSPYLTFNGQCEMAFRYYEKCLGGKIAFMMTYRESPMAGQTPPDWGEKISHATFTLGDQILSGVDVCEDQYAKPQGFMVMLSPDNAEEADRIFHGLAENGTVQMPIQETFWALRFGVLVDQFGTPWMINCEKTM
jgi:PhnB protein